MRWLSELNDSVSAKKLVAVHGQQLVGMTVLTWPMGNYPGGLATVVEVAPDPSAPEIVFNVEHPTFGEIGVFEYECVRLA